MTPSLTTAALRPAALAILRSGRLTVLHVIAVGAVVEEVIARVQSSRTGGPRYAVDLIGGRWACTCAGFGLANRCAHLLATQMVTGHTPAGDGA